MATSAKNAKPMTVNIIKGKPDIAAQLAAAIRANPPGNIKDDYQYQTALLTLDKGNIPVAGGEGGLVKKYCPGLGLSWQKDVLGR